MDLIHALYRNGEEDGEYFSECTCGARGYGVDEGEAWEALNRHKGMALR